MSLTQEELKTLLEYNPETGDWKWLVKRSSRCKKDWFKGNLSKHGYYEIRLNYILYKSHQLAFLYMLGYFPKEIDHINGVRVDNSFVNLREVTHMQNMQNISKPTIKNKSGFLGVVKQKEKYLAYIKANKTNYYLGTFDTAELAADAYKQAKEQYHYQSN